MPRKSPKNSRDIGDLFDADELEVSMLLYINNDGERVYLHSFDTDIMALEFLENMVSGLRADILETLMKRSLN